MSFAYPYVLALLVPILLDAAWAGRRRAPVVHSQVAAVVAAGLPRGRWARLHRLPMLLRVLALSLLVIALARPQEGVEAGVRTTHGVDIMLALDLSSSMAAEDFPPNRLAVAKDVVARFVMAREHDRVGLVVFAADAFTQAPLTLDHDLLARMVREVDIGLIQDGTAIGNALATAVGRLADSAADSRLVILLTDGVNNHGDIDPATAAQMAEGLGIRVYTVAVGGDGGYLPRRGGLFGRVPVRSEVDETLLREIAERTGGQFFRAASPDALREIYRRIDALETSPFEALPVLEYRDQYHGFLIAALALLLLEWGLAVTRFRRFDGASRRNTATGTGTIHADRTELP